MLAKERLDKIMKFLDEEGVVHVKHLAHYFNVTEDLIRKDLKKLEQLDVIDRIHGGAERKKNKFEVSTIQHRMAVNDEAKMKIAEKAYETIQAGEHIFLDTSSTSAHIAYCIARGDKEITVVTDMLHIMQVLSYVPQITLIGISGVFNHYTGGFHSHQSIHQINRLSLDRAFVSCRSIDLSLQGVYEGFMDIAETKKAILDAARIKCIATQVQKFENKGVFKFYDLQDLDVIIGEESLSTKQMQVLDQMKVRYL